MISGDGFFVTRLGNDTVYTRAGAFDFDADGRLVTRRRQDRAGLLGRRTASSTTDGAVGDIMLPLNGAAPAAATTGANVAGNLPSETAVGDDADARLEGLRRVRHRAHPDADVHAHRRAAGTSPAPTAAAPPAAPPSPSPTAPRTAPARSTVGGVTVDLSKVTGFAALNTVAVTEQNGREAGTLQGLQRSRRTAPSSGSSATASRSPSAASRWRRSPTPAASRRPALGLPRHGQLGQRGRRRPRLARRRLARRAARSR